MTIIKDIPYDRPLTTMASFPMCPVCKREYQDPANRRFHAQPIACPDCGPAIWFKDKAGNIFNSEDGLQKARSYLADGKIIAIKGLGGFHLACSATDEAAVATLRKRKKRSQKPFAVMAFDIRTIEKYCRPDQFESSLILSKEKPIVIVDKRDGASIPEIIAPGRHTIGVMLPYTPLHLLLLEPEKGFPDLFVMTSGNISEEPIAYKNIDSMEHLNEIADGFLLHDRDIHVRVDDSVVTTAKDRIYFLRRSRGYAPRAISVPKTETMELAVGAELKNAFCLTKSNYGFVSHHIGDLKNYETFQSFRENISHYQNIFNISPQTIACDLHPDYLSTKFAKRFGRENGIPVVSVQHHHAHLASCLADNGIFDGSPAMGFIFDGTGYGPDGTIWGGEVLIGNMKGYARAYHLEAMPLPGGDSAVLHPNRIAISYLLQNNILLDQNIPTVSLTEQAEINTLSKQISAGINTAYTTSMGRLFDAVASLIGLRQSITYEAQAAIELEQIIDPTVKSAYAIHFSDQVIKVGSVLEQIIEDIKNNIPKSVISTKFHNSIVQLVGNIAETIRTEQDISQVALSGGVWQNKYLLCRSISHLKSKGFSVLYHQQVPANDGGIALGQAAILRSTN